LRSARNSSAVTSACRVVRSALTPGRPGACPAGGADRDSGVNVDAIEMIATRPLSVST
jgi:hypothetical protein